MTRTPSTARSAATLHDVAREAGVSLATASRVLNGSTRKVAESYREKVEAAAERLGYTANLSAQATARGTSAVVALLVADIADPYFGQLASGVARGADEAGLVVTIAITERDPAREVSLVRALRGQRPRGLILAASRTTGPDAAGLDPELEAFQGMGGRVVMLGPAPDSIRSVTVDNRGGARALGARLRELGYRARASRPPMTASRGSPTASPVPTGASAASFAAASPATPGTPPPRRSCTMRCPRARSSSASATSSRSA